MKHSQPTQEPGLPEDLALQFRLLAESETAGTRPFPRVNTAIRRRRVTRYGGVALAGAVAAVVVAVEVLSGGVIDRADQSTPARPIPSGTVAPTKEPATPEEAGYPTQTVGSLASDPTWLTALRNQLHARNDWHDSKEPPIAADDMLVAAAGDIEDRARYAVVLFHWTTKGRTYWDRSVLLGAAGATAAKMSATGYDGAPEKPDQVPHEPFTLFDSPGPGANDPGRAVVVVVAPGATRPAIADDRIFGVGGDGQELTSITRRAVPRIGPGVWAGPITANEYMLSEVSMEMGNTLAGGSSVTRTPGFDLAAVASPGTDPAGLGILSGSLGDDNVSIDDVPVWAGTASPSSSDQVAATIFRSVNGVYVAAFADGQKDPDDDPNGRVIQRGHMVTKAATDGEAMAGVWVDGGRTRRYLVIAPEKAAEVRIGKVTAPVHHRLAVVDVPEDLSSTADQEPGRKAEALAADGSVITRITPEKAQESMLLDSRDDDPGDGTSVRP